jgi:hypothetical protein
VKAEIKALIISGNKFLYASVKGICRLWAQPRFDAFHQLLIFIESLWSWPVLQVGKQEVVARSEIMAVRRVVKQLPVEMLQQRSSASSCVRMRTVTEEYYTGCQYFTLFLVFRNTLVTLLWSLVAWIPLSVFLSYPRKQLPSALWQADVCLNFFGLSSECVRIHCFDCSLVSTFTNETQVSSPVTRTMWLRNSSPSLWYRSKKSQSRSHPLRFFTRPWAFSEPTLR